MITFEVELQTIGVDQEGKHVFHNRVYIPCFNRQDAVRLRDLLQANVSDEVHYYVLDAGAEIRRRAEVMAKFHLGDRTTIRVPASHVSSAAAQLRHVADELVEESSHKKPLRAI